MLRPDTPSFTGRFVAAPEGWVGIALTTHDAGNRITGADLDLADRIESFSWV